MESFISAYSLQSITKGRESHYSNLKLAPEAEALEEQFTSLPILSCTACFLLLSMTICIGVVQPTMGSVFPHKLLIKK